jgi:hypothetical protein
VTARPPRLSEALMRWSLPRTDREIGLGDLAEEFSTRASTEGARPARAWYRRQVRRSLGPNITRYMAEHAPARLRLAPADWIRDLRGGVRSLRSTPGFTLAALGVLTLGIGATTAIFSVVDAVALRPLPYADDARLMVVRETQKAGAPSVVDPRDFVDWRAQQDVFEDLAAASGSNTTDFVDRSRGAQERVSVLRVTANLFPLLRDCARAGPFVHHLERGRRQRPHRRAERCVLAASVWRRSHGGRANTDARQRRVVDRGRHAAGVHVSCG